MELRQYVGVLRRHLALVVITVIAALGASWAATPRTSQYAAEATIYVGARQLVLSNGGVSNDVLTGVERLISTYAEMIHSEPIATAALDQTKLPRSAAGVVAETAALPEAGTQLLHVRVTDRSPSVAQELANALATAFVDRVQTFEPTRPAQEGTVPSLPAYVFERAKLPTAPEPTGLGRNLILAGLLGFLASAGVAFLLEYLDVTIKNPHDAERRLELPVLGVIPLQRQPAPVAGQPRPATLTRQSA